MNDDISLALSFAGRPPVSQGPPPPPPAPPASPVQGPPPGPSPAPQGASFQGASFQSGSFQGPSPQGAPAQGPPPSPVDPIGQIGAWARTASPAQRAAVADRLGDLAQIAAVIGARSPDPQARLSLARHMAALHPQYGVDPSSLDASQFTDQAMRAQVAQQLAARALLQGGFPAPPSYPATPSNWETIR